MHPEPVQASQSLRKAQPVVNRHATWKKVSTGNCRNPSDFLERLSALRVESTASAVKLIEHVCDGSMEENSVMLVVKTVSELGFKSPTTLREVMGACMSQGLTYCPKDTALAIISEYADLPEGEKVIVLSIPIEVSRLPCYFVVRRSSTSIELNGISIGKDDLLDPHEKLMLAKVCDFARAD